MSSASQSTSAASLTPPDGASCWLCLEEGPDDSGAPLVRDCSCRGHSGFAHVTCLVKYAESKSKDLAERGVFEHKFFEHCPNCKQAFQGDLYYDMTKAQLEFMERESKHVLNWYLIALMKRISVLNAAKEADRIEGEAISAKMLSLIDEMKNSNHPLLGNVTLTGVYQAIGVFCAMVGTKQCLRKAKHYLEKSKDIITALGDRELHWAAKSIEDQIATVEARISGDSLPTKKDSDLSDLRGSYNYMLQINGENDVRSIGMGVHLASGLSLAYHTIEASRLLHRLVIISRRVHGSDHKETKNAELWWQKLKLRYVVWIETEEIYQVLRYENDGKSCVIQGPVSKVAREDNGVSVETLESNAASGTAAVVPSEEILFPCGLPVMLHGLKKAAHLNGEIGDVRGYCTLSDQCVVHLEDKDLKPVKVKHENLRIVFDLPDPKNLD